MSKATSLSDQLTAAGIPIQTVRDNGTALEIVYAENATPQQITQGNAILAAFDYSDAAQAIREIAEQRQASMSAFLNDTSPTAQITRALALVLMDEINILRQGERVGTATGTWDAPSIANGAGATSPVLTVAGALVTDLVEVIPPANTAGLIVTGFVSAPNSVQVRLDNQTGGSVNLASGVWGVRVYRPTILPVRTAQQLTDAVTAKIQVG